jgi:uncharacterized repeat protein (TIGR01451 family)
LWLIAGLILALAALASASGTVLADDPEPQPEPRIVSPKIVGGSTTQAGDWPWQVALLFNGTSPSSGQFCGGSLITDEWVVTAAHCAAVTSSIDIQAGIHTLSSNAGQRRDVVTTIIHPSYNDSTFDNDIALMKLSAPVTLSSTVATIVPLIPEDGALADPGVTATITGWGTTISGDSDSASDVLLQVDVPIISNPDCNASTSYNGSITANMMCAGLIDDGGKDSCQGDSGGPLVVPDGASYRLAGVVSWGIGCALPRLPGVYTRVTEMRDFINQHTGVFSTDISLNKTVSPRNGQPGGELTYAITVSNPGSVTATGVIVTDPLPASITLLSVTSAQGTCVGAQIVSCSLGNINAGSSASLTVNTRVEDGFSGTISNTATTTTTALESNSQNNSASASVYVAPKADLSITKTASESSVVAGGLLTYTLTVTNHGPSTSTEATITDTLPSGLTLTATSTSGASCNGESVITCSFESIASGSSAVVTLTTLVANADLGVLVNTATISTSTPQDPKLSNNAGTATTSVLVSDISVSQTVSPPIIVAGNEVTFTINVLNIGSATATGVTLSDTLPSSLKWNLATSTRGACDIFGDCALGDIAVGESAGITLRASVSLGVSGQIENTVVASSTSFDRSTGNNQASATAVVTPAPADLSISKTAPSEPVVAGSEIGYIIKVTNDGPATSTNTSITDNLPEGVSLIAAIPTQGICSGVSIITCDLGQLSAGDAVDVSMRVRIATSTRGQLVNVAVASSTAPDNVLDNNTAVAVTQIPSVGALGMAALAAMFGASILWKSTFRRRMRV